MAAAIGLRNDFGSWDLRTLAKTTCDASQARRLLVLAEIYDGGSRTDAARIGGVGLQTVRDWVVRFNTFGPDGLIDSKAPGNTAKLNAEQRADPIPGQQSASRVHKSDLGSNARRVGAFLRRLRPLI